MWKLWGFRMNSLKMRFHLTVVETEVEFKAVVGPGAKLKVARLLVKWEIGDVDAASALEENECNMMHVTSSHYFNHITTIYNFSFTHVILQGAVHCTWYPKLISIASTDGPVPIGRWPSTDTAMTLELNLFSIDVSLCISDIHKVHAQGIILEGPV